MIKSTNQVTQFFVVEKTAVLKEIKDPKGTAITGYQIVVDGNDTTDVIPAKQVLGVNFVESGDSSEIMYRKAMKVKLSSAVNRLLPQTVQTLLT